MKKNNCKGFMLAETLVVSSFIAVILIYLFVQFRSVNLNYGKTLKYNGVNELYLLNEVKKYMETTDLENLSFKISYGSDKYVVLSDCSSSIFNDPDYCKVLFRSANIKKAVYMKSDNIVFSDSFPQDFNDYLKTIRSNDNSYIIAASFNDGSFANLKMSGFMFTSLDEKIKNNDIKLDVSSGAGLYYNSLKSNYVYKSDSIDKLNNNIEILGYKGRIISLDDQGVKVVLDLKENVIYDSSQNYFTSNSMLFNGNYLSDSSLNSSLFSVLNANLEESDLILKDASYGVGFIDSVIGNSLKSIINSEKQTTYKINTSNYIATLNVSDIIMSSLNNNCDYENITNDCLKDNWLSDNLWTMNYSLDNNVWNIYNNEFINSQVGTNVIRNAYMVVYLDSNLSVIGDGSINYPYKFK